MIDREMLLIDLEECSDVHRWKVSCSSSGSYAARAAMLGLDVYDTYSKSMFAWFGGRYYCYNGKIYEPIDIDLLKWSIQKLTERMSVDAGIRSKMGMLREQMFLAVKMERELHPRFNIRAFKNGVVDIMTGDLKPFGKQWDVTYINDYNFDANADCPLWKSFLKQVLPEKNSRLLLQMFLGLTTMNRSEMGAKIENCLALYGNGSNGKSVINDVVRGVYGAENISTMSIGSILKDGDEGMRARCQLVGKYINYSGEVNEKELFGREAAFKSFISGEEQHARFLRGNVFTITNVPWQIFNFNNLPVTSDKSYGFFRRFLYLIFNETIPEEMQNKSLGEELRAEYSGILNWIIRGGKYLKQHQFKFPRSENGERQKLVSVGMSNPLLSWAMYLRLSPSKRAEGEEFRWVQSNILRKSLDDFCIANNFEMVTQTAFGRAMTKLGFGGQNRKRVGAGIMYKIYGFSKEVENYTQNELSLETWKLQDDAEFDDVAGDSI